MVATAHISTISPLHARCYCTYRKMFGDEIGGSTKPSRYLRITMNTSYRCTTQHIQQQGGSGELQEGGVCTRVHRQRGTNTNPASQETIYTYPRWTQRTQQGNSSTVGGKPWTCERRLTYSVQ